MVVHENNCVTYIRIFFVGISFLISGNRILAKSPDLSYGDVITVQHNSTKKYLSAVSNSKIVGASSVGQDCEWLVEGDKSYGTKVGMGDTIYLYSLTQQCYLYKSSTSGSPVTGQGEVKGGSRSKAGLKYDDSKNFEKGIRFIFHDRWTLHSHPDTFEYNGKKYQEITAYDEFDDDNDFWSTSIVFKAIPDSKRVTCTSLD